MIFKKQDWGFLPRREYIFPLDSEGKKKNVKSVQLYNNYLKLILNLCHFSFHWTKKVVKFFHLSFLYLCIRKKTNKFPLMGFFRQWKEGVKSFLCRYSSAVNIFHAVQIWHIFGCSQMFIKELEILIDETT